MGIEKGITLSWLKIILVCVAMLGSVYMTLVKADDRQKEAIANVAKEVKKEVKTVAECKLDKTAFTSYKIEHQRTNEKLLSRFETEFKNMKKQSADDFKEVREQVADSEKKIIRILTIQEERRRNDGD